MKAAVLQLVAAALLTGVCGQNEIEGYIMGWIGGQGRGTHVILARQGLVTVDKDERTLVLSKRREDTWPGSRVRIITRPCEETDPCDERPAHWKGIAAAIYPAEQQRSEYIRATEVVHEFLRSLWESDAPPAGHLLSGRCRGDARAAAVIQKLRARAKGGDFTPLQLYGFNAWAFTALRPEGAQVITDPSLFEPKTGLRIELTFQGTEVLIDDLVEEPPTTHERWLAGVLR